MDLRRSSANTKITAQCPCALHCQHPLLVTGAGSGTHFNRHRPHSCVCVEPRLPSIGGVERCKEGQKSTMHRLSCQSRKSQWHETKQIGKGSVAVEVANERQSPAAQLFLALMFIQLPQIGYSAQHRCAAQKRQIDLPRGYRYEERTAYKHTGIEALRPKSAVVKRWRVPLSRVACCCPAVRVHRGRCRPVIHVCVRAAAIA